MRRFILLVVALTFLLLNSAVAWADETAAPELTLQQAIDKAKANSETLKSAKYDIERGYQVRKFDADKVTFTPIGTASDSSSRAFTGLIQADMNWQMAQKTYNAQEDSLVMQTLKAYNALLLAQEKVKVADVQLKNADLQRMVAEANYRVGLLNKMSLLQAQTTQEAAKAGMEAANKALEDSYQKFNQLVGLYPADRPVLVDKPKFDELKIDDLDAEVGRAMAASPTVWLAQQKVDLAKLTLDLYDYTSTSRSEPYDAKIIDVTKAQLSAMDTNEQLQKLVRTLYFSVKQLEEQYMSAQESVKVAEEALRVVKVKYDVGMATRAEISAAELTLAQANQSVLDYSSQHEILALAFSKPWAYAAS